MSKKFVTSVAALAAVSLVSSSFAQVVATSGNAQFSQSTTVYPGGAVGLFDTGSGAVSPNSGGFTADLIADLPTPDSLVRHGWSYRPSTASTVLQLSFGNAQNLSNGAVVGGSGNSRTIRINNVGNATEQADFLWTYTLTDGGSAGSATLNASLVLVNRLSTAATFRVGVYSDIDVGGTLANDAVTALTGNVARFVDGVNFAETAAPGAIAYQYGETTVVGAAGALPSDVLANTPALNTAIGPNNASSAYIYSIDVPAGIGSQSTAVSYSITLGVVPEPTALLGLAALPLVLRRRSK